VCSVGWVAGKADAATSKVTSSCMLDSALRSHRLSLK
jgi:hypothetical protein